MHLKLQFISANVLPKSSQKSKMKKSKDPPKLLFNSLNASTFSECLTK